MKNHKKNESKSVGRSAEYQYASHQVESGDAPNSALGDTVASRSCGKSKKRWITTNKYWGRRKRRRTLKPNIKRKRKAESKFKWIHSSDGKRARLKMVSSPSLSSAKEG